MNTSVSYINVDLTTSLQSILEVDRDGIILDCFGKNCVSAGQKAEKLVNGINESTFWNFFGKVVEREEVGIESYFTDPTGILTKLSFMGKRGDTYILLKTDVDGNGSGVLQKEASEIIHIIDAEGNLIFRNRLWNEKMGYANDRGSKDLNVKELIQPEYEEACQAYFSSFGEDLSEQPKVWGLKTKENKEIFVECTSELQYINGQKALVCSMTDITNSVSALQHVNDQSARIKAIFQTGNILFWSVNENKSLTSFNEAYSETIRNHYGISPEVNSDLGRPKKKFASEDYHNFWDKKYDQVFKTGEGINFLTKTDDRKGKTYFREIYLNPIMSGKKVKEVAGLALDVTEQKIQGKKVQDQSKKINTIFNATNHMIWSVDKSLELTFFNEFYREKINKRYAADIVIGTKVFEVGDEVDEETRNLWMDRYSRVFEGEKLRFGLNYKDLKGNDHSAEVTLNPIHGDDGKVTEVAGISQAVTYKKAAEKKLKAQAAKIQAIFDSSAMLIWTIDRDYRVVSYNRVFAERHFALLGKEVSIGSDFLKLFKNHLDKDEIKNLKGFFKAALKGKEQQFEGKLRAKDNSKVWMETFFSPIHGEDNKINEISCMSHDISAKKTIEKQMQESLNEKEILLQEVHHRVKNNLQIISSILNLQSSYVKDDSTLTILRESQNRIKSMSFIHESLYQTRDFSGIEFSVYIMSLAKNLIHSYSWEVGLVKLKTDFDDTFLSLDQAIPCGLIANEIISNALKYAFDEGQPGEIFVSTKEKEGKVSLIISDNGKGLPEGFDHETSESLGLQLVYTLIDQLDATIQVTSKRGTKYLITFDKQ